MTTWEGNSDRFRYAAQVFSQWQTRHERQRQLARELKTSDPDGRLDRMQNNQSRKQHFAISLTLLIAGTLAAPYGYTLVSDMLGSYDWTPTPATMETYSAVCERRRRSPDCHVYVKYRYRWNDQEYTSELMNTAPGYVALHSLNQAELYVHQRYPSGSVQTAYVNPRNPEQAVLQNGIREPYLFLMGLLLMLLPVSGASGLLFRNKQPYPSVGRR